MARPPIKPVDDKLRIVLAVLRGEVSIKEAARRERGLRDLDRGLA